jgi:hypothetical protein
MHPIFVRALAADRVREWQREAAADRMRRQARQRAFRARAARRGGSPAGPAATAGPAGTGGPAGAARPARAGRVVRVAWRVAAACAVAAAGAVLRAAASPLAGRMANVLADIRLAQRTTAIRRAGLDQHLPAPHRAPADYLEFLARTSGPLLHEPPAAGRRQGQQVR